MNPPTSPHNYNRPLNVPDVPSQSLVPSLKKKPFRHSQRYAPTWLKQLWSPHTWPVLHSSTSVAMGEMKQLRAKKKEKKGRLYHRTFTARAVLTQMKAPPAGDCVFVANEGTLCVHAGLARQARAGMGHTLVYIYYKHTAGFSGRTSNTRPPIVGQRSRMISTWTLSSPAQLPAASSIKPAGQVLSG